jgi:hypothetical protein
MFDFLPELALPTQWSLLTIYMTCAVVGLGVTVVQLVLGLFGLGGDEVDLEGGDGDLGYFSVRAISGFLAIFGLAGWACTEAGLAPPLGALIATLAGSCTFALIAWMLRQQRRLESSGTIDPRNAVGSAARVYLRIPAAESGQGKITVEVQGRTAEFVAFTRGAELRTGAEVRVVRMSSPGIFEVEALGASPPPTP